VSTGEAEMSDALHGDAALNFLKKLSDEQRHKDEEALRAAKEEAQRTGRRPIDFDLLRKVFGDAPQGVMQWVPWHAGADEAAAIRETESWYYIREPELRSTQELIEFWMCMEAGAQWKPKPDPPGEPQ
jgi:hypothetical protein